MQILTFKTTTSVCQSSTTGHKPSSLCAELNEQHLITLLPQYHATDSVAAFLQSHVYVHYFQQFLQHSLMAHTQHYLNHIFIFCFIFAKSNLQCAHNVIIKLLQNFSISFHVVNPTVNLQLLTTCDISAEYR